MEEYLTSKAMISNFEQLKRIFRFFIWLNSRLLLDILKVNRLKDISVIGEGLCTVLPLTARMYSSVNWCAEHIAQRWGGLTVLPLTARIYSSVNCCAEHIAQRWGGLTTAIDCKNVIKVLFSETKEMCNLFRNSFVNRKHSYFLAKQFIRAHCRGCFVACVTYVLFWRQRLWILPRALETIILTYLHKKLLHLMSSGGGHHDYILQISIGMIFVLGETSPIFHFIRCHRWKAWPHN